jgi:SRSO17 transposase
MFDDTEVSARFAGYMSYLTGRLGDTRRCGPFEAYCRGLMVTPGRKSAEPMAAVMAPGHVGAVHQSLLHIVSQSAWSDETVLAAVRDWVLPAMVARSPVEAWIIDDTGLPKKGRHSVGVSRQYCGQSGKKDNCQVAVSLSVCTQKASLPVAWRLYLPQSWTHDVERRAEAHVPHDVDFKTKPEIALEQIRAALKAGIAPGVVLMDAAYGNSSVLRCDIHDLGLGYSVNVTSKVTVWRAGETPEVPHKRPGRGGKSVRLRQPDGQGPLSVKQLAVSLDEAEWHTVTWREGTNATLSGRFAALRVHHAYRHLEARSLARQEWLLIEWPEGAEEPAKYWLSNLPEDIALTDLVQISKMRWRIERDYQELKQELGLGHFEGRLWRGFHHHATLCIAAYGFLIAERAAFPPSANTTANPVIKKSTLPETYRPRGGALKRPTSSGQLNSNP